MRLSTLKEIPRNTSVVDVFGGLNHNIRINDGEFYDMKNMTSDFFPVLSPRKKRGRFKYATEGEHKINGIITKDVLCYVDGTKMYIGENEVEGFELEDSPKTMVNMGAYLIIMPDKKFINTRDFEDKGNIEANFDTLSEVTYSMCRIDGTEYENVTVSKTAPANPENLAYWIDTSSTPHTLKQYSKASDMWTPVATTYVRIAAKDIAKEFSQYDGTKITGIDETIEQLKDLEGQTSVLWEVHRDEDGDGAGDYVVVIGFLDEVKKQTSPLKLQRQMPIMDFVIESGNRLWGCRYGKNNSGDVVNEIYASKIGDFRNWNTYMGISTDSYTASCGTEGEWTGAITYLGAPLFFKENYMHKVYGSYPGNFQIQYTECRGVMKGASKSLAILNETLIYKSRYGICRYDGSAPVDISSQFGGIRYSAVEAGENELTNGAVAGSYGKKYYISMKSEADNKWYLLVYDSKNGLWHKEDETRVGGFASCDDEMFFIDRKDNKIKTIVGKDDTEDGDVEWMAETGVVGTSIKSTPLPGKKYISQMIVRMSMEIGASVMFYIQYDSQGEWEHITTVTGTNLKSFAAPIRPKRCDHFRLRIVGKGNVKIYSITKMIEKGSET